MTTGLKATWLLVAAGIAVAALTIHVVMLQVFDVPYPDMAGIGIYGLVAVFGRVLALLVVCRLAAPWMQARPLALQWGLVALLDTALAGNVRSAVMQAVVTEAIAFPVVTLAQDLATSLVLAAIIVLANRLARAPALLVLAALAATAAMAFAVGPFIAAAVQPFQHLARIEVHVPPYGAYVLGWSYTTFLETVFAVIAVAGLVGRRLSPHPWRALAQFTVLALLLRGTLVMQLLFPPLMKGGFWPSALSTSQFFLQDLAMVLLVWWAWRALADHPDPDAGAVSR